jgi:ABC-2 type transport system ATP-binding protein
MLTDTDPNTQAGETLGMSGAGAASSRALSAVGTIADQTGDSPVVALEGVHKRFNDIYALSNVSISIQRGEVFSLLGPTGSGKSTLVRLLLGFLQPDEGTVSLFGTTDPRSVAARIGYMPERPYYHHNFTGRDYLFFQARLSGLTRAGARRAVERAIEAVGLGPVARRHIKFYERETLQRLALAVAIVSVADGPPGLLILDEPSESLTRTVQLAVRNVILDLKQRGATVLIASHRITEIEHASTSVGILRGGRLMTQTYVENNPRVIIVAAPREGALESYDRLLAHLRNLHPFVTLTGGGRRTEMGTAPLVISLPSGPHIRNAAGIKASALRALVDAGWDVLSVYVERKDLESIYAQTAPPKPQSVQSAGSAATGPLPNVTTPLGPGPVSMNTAPMPNLAQGLGGGNTRPLHASEVGQMGPGEGSGALNGHQPIEGRALRGEQK